MAEPTNDSAPFKPFRVLLGGDHPWSGHTGEAKWEDNLGLRVRLDVGPDVYALPGQWRRLTNVC